MRLIDADALMQSLGITDMDCDECSWQDKEWSRCKRGGDFEDACCAIEDAPTIEERKKGKWMSHYDYCKKHKLLPSGLVAFWWCDQCEQAVEHPTNFCPNCGSDNRGDRDE